MNTTKPDCFFFLVYSCATSAAQRSRCNEGGTAEKDELQAGREESRGVLYIFIPTSVHSYMYINIDINTCVHLCIYVYIK